MEAPFDHHGNLMHYPRIYWENETRCNPEWREVEPFSAPLYFVGQERGRSAAYFLWKNLHTGCTFPMFMKDLGDLIR